MKIESTGQRIKKAIKDSGLKLNHIAEKLDISPQQLSRLFKNNTGRSKYIPQIAEILNVSQKWLEMGTLKANLIILQMLDAEDILALIEDSDIVNVNEISKFIFDSIPIYSASDHFKFCYKNTIDISANLKAHDILVFEMIIPLKSDLNKKIIMIYSYGQQKIQVGVANIDFETKKLLIVTNEEIYFFTKHDLIIATCSQAFIPDLQKRLN